MGALTNLPNKRPNIDVKVITYNIKFGTISTIK